MEKKSGQEKQKSPALEKENQILSTKICKLIGGEGPLGKQYKVGIVVSRYLKKGTIKKGLKERVYLLRQAYINSKR